MGFENSEMGGLRPAQLSMLARMRFADIIETDIGADAGGAVRQVIPPMHKDIVVFGLMYTATELANAAAINEQQTITLANGSSGETFKLAFNGSEKTGALAYNISAADLQTALRALTTINGANVTVSGSAGGPYTVTFTGTLAGADQPIIVASDAGGDLTVTPAESVKGVTLANSQGRIKIGTFDGSADDDDSICDVAIPAACAVNSTNHVYPSQLAITLKNTRSPVAYRGYPVVPAGKAINATIVKQDSGNDGKIIGKLAWCFIDD